MSTNAAPAEMSPADIARTVEDAWEAFLRADRRAAAPHPNYVYASAWRVCERRMVYELVMPDQQQPFDVQALARFRRGNDRERDILADLSRIGRNATPEFNIVGQQEAFKLRDRKGRQVISGKVDAFLQIVLARKVRAPFEIKAWHANIVERIETFDDLFENPWTRSGAYQLLSYLYGHGLPLGFMVLDRGGLPKLLPVLLEEHLDKMEEFLTKAERVVDHALTWVNEPVGTLPDFIDDPIECRRCPFYGAVCNPPLSAQDVRIFTDPAFEAQLQRWHDLKAAGKEWASLDDRLKKQLRGVENGLAGRFAITGRWGNYTRVDVPDDVRKKYTVTDPKGRFTLDIIRTPDPENQQTGAADGQTQGTDRRSDGVLRTGADRNSDDRPVDRQRRRRPAKPAGSEGAQVLPFDVEKRRSNGRRRKQH